MKKIKKILVITLIFVIVFMIYIFNIDKDIYYVALGDSLAAGQNPYNEIAFGYSDYVSNYLQENKLLEYYTKEYAKSGYRTTDLINDIENNKKIKINNKETGLKTVLRDSDLITLSIGANDIFYKLGLNGLNINLDRIDNIYKYIDETLKDTEKLINLLTKYCKKEIILVGYYNPIKSSELTRELEPIFEYLNQYNTKLANKYKIHYVDIYEIFKENPEYLPNPLDIHPSAQGYQVIASQIIDVIEKNIIR